MTLNNCAPVNFGSRFSIRLQNSKGAAVSAPAETMHIGDSLIDNITPMTDQRPIIGRIDRNVLTRGYQYELPGIMRAFANNFGIDVACLDRYDDMISTQLQTLCDERRPHTAVRNVGISLQTIPNSSILLESELEHQGDALQTLYLNA